MRFICPFVILFAVLLAHAQEADTAFVSAADGDSVVAEDIILGDNIRKIQTDYYRDLAGGERQKFVGTLLYVGGGIFTCLSVALTVAYVKSYREFKRTCQGDLCDDAGSGITLVFLAYGVSAGMLVPAYFVYARGEEKLKRADFYGNILRQRGEVSMSIRLFPVVDPVERSLGGILALDF